jgi:hypothetical protein
VVIKGSSSATLSSIYFGSYSFGIDGLCKAILSKNLLRKKLFFYSVNYTISRLSYVQLSSSLTFRTAIIAGITVTLNNLSTFLADL